MREALRGSTRFYEFRGSLSIEAGLLTRGLASLVRAGLLDRRRYCDRPPRYEYLLTARGRDFEQAILAVLVFGNNHFSTDGRNLVIVHRATGELADPLLIDRRSGQIITMEEYTYAAGMHPDPIVGTPLADISPMPKSSGRGRLSRHNGK